MKKNFKLYALLLTLGLGATRISFAPEEHLPEHAPAHEPERAPHKTPEEEIQKRHSDEQRELNDQQKSEKRTTERQIDNTATANKTGRKAQDAQTTAIENLKEKGITIGDPKASDAAQEAKNQLADKHAQEKSNLDAKHADEKAAATKATDDLDDAFKELSENKPEEPTKEELAKDNDNDNDNDNEKPQEEAKSTEEPTAKEKATAEANKKETIESTALVIKDILSSADDFNKEAGFDVIDPNEIKDLNKNLDEAKTATGKKYNTLIDYINAILSDLMRILKNLTSPMPDSLQKTLDKLSVNLDAMKEKRAKEQEQNEKPAKEKPAEEEPAKEEPAKEEPAKEEPAKEEPAKEEPSKKEPAQAKPETPKTPKEKALDALGLTGDPTWEEVKDAYKKLHPDKQLSKYKEQHPESQERLSEKTGDPTINKKNKKINEERVKLLNDFINKSDEIFKSLPSLSDLKTMFS